MTDYALTSLQPAASQVMVNHGLLNSPDMLGLLFTGVALLSLCIMLGPARESIKALWAPVGRFMAGLHVTGMWEGLFAWAAFSGAFLRPQKTFWDNWPEDDPDEEEQLLRMAYPGFVPPETT